MYLAVNWKQIITEKEFFPILKRTVIISLLILALWVNLSFFNYSACYLHNVKYFPCLTSQQDCVFGTTWSFGQIPISSTWILLNIVAGNKLNNSPSIYDSIETTIKQILNSAFLK